MTSPPASSVLSVRISPAERALLEAAADQARTNVSDFVRRKAIEAAENEILNRTVVAIPAENWEAFEAWAKRPGHLNPALQELLSVTPTWER